MFEAKGEGILSWCADDNFILEDDLAPDFEVLYINSGFYFAVQSMLYLKLLASNDVLVANTVLKIDGVAVTTLLALCGICGGRFCLGSPDNSGLLDVCVKLNCKKSREIFIKLMDFIIILTKSRVFFIKFTEYGTITKSLGFFL